MENKILVASWGYSMILTTWVQVIKVSPKTLLVREIVSRGLTEKELEEKKLKPAYLQMYSVAKEPVEFRKRNGKDGEPFRLYKRGNHWVGTTDHGSTQFRFEEWNGEPQFEDHCD
jgi:hypothetical protein